MVQKKPIGVWFSVALALMIGGAWAGWKIGIEAAARWHLRTRFSGASAGAEERAQFAADTSLLSPIQMTAALRYALSCSQDARPKVLDGGIKVLRELRDRYAGHKFVDVIALNLGYAYVAESVYREERHERSEAAEAMQSAESIFQSLGWKDVRPETLKSAATYEADPFRTSSGCGDPK